MCYRVGSSNSCVWFLSLLHFIAAVNTRAGELSLHKYRLAEKWGWLKIHNVLKLEDPPVCSPPPRTAFWVPASAGSGAVPPRVLCVELDGGLAGAPCHRLLPSCGWDTLLNPRRGRRSDTLHQRRRKVIRSRSPSCIERSV